MTESSGSPLLGIEDLRIDFATERGWTNVLNGVSFDIQKNQIVVLVGESGSGKTVTSLSVLGLVPRAHSRKAGGHIWYGGRDLTELPVRELRDIRGNEISMIFQEPMTSLNPAFTIGDQIAEAYRRHRGGKKRAALARAAEMLDLVGIPNAGSRVRDYPHEFSGGMRQRAMIAMALICEPRLLIADEPTTALDVTVQAQIVELLMRLRDETGCGILFVTHDLGVVAELADKVVVMYAGEVVETAVARDLYIRPRHPYTEGLLAAMPQQGVKGQDLPTIPGRTPDPWDMPAGCRFSPRCGHAREECRSDAITLRPLDDGRACRCRRCGDLTLAGVR
ncbi:ABC transporter ATP-binding protein [Spongiactinospora sp. TRM90649]|uniref:ABC transporter ATP-binding protein n=1 Tax=Spongiactinospora sp. TRM90649 TaxID=3031114 RepID=UPI0023F772C3|nr:ABC transporter ATP-binding protein [Spongiactinospora sp. TRM90649]MDF5754331.1 ABC transporter ATP-binding protein [Spongiactinospora sp. TRM90649]